MGQYGGTAGGLIGSVLGSYFGPVGSAIGGLAGGLIGNMLFNKQNKPLINDIQIGNASYGNPIPILYGTARLSATMIWETQIQQKSAGLFKGGMSGSSTFIYHQSAAFAFCEGPANFVKIFLDGVLFFDTTSTNPTELTKHNKFSIRTYQGTEDQLPDYIISSWIQNNVDVPAASPAYRGIAYMVFDGVNLTPYGNRMPQVSVVWSSNAALTTVFKPLATLSPDPAPGSLPNLTAWSPSVASAVDWTRNLLYVLQTDVTVTTNRSAIRVYDLVTEQCVMVKTQDELGLFYPALAACAFLNGLCCGQGTKLYLVGYVRNFPDTTYNGVYMWTIDPATLTVINQITLPFPEYSALGAMLCFTLTDLYNSYEMVAGADFFAGGFVVDPFDGHIGIVPTNTSAYNAGINVILGNQDPIDGLTDIWFVDNNLSFADPPPQVIGRVQVAGNDPSNLASFYKVEATLYPADLGLTAIGAITGITHQSCIAVYDATDDSLILTHMTYCAGYDHTLVTAKWGLVGGVSGTGRVVWTNYTWDGPQLAMVNTSLGNGTIGGAISFSGGVPVLDTGTGVESLSPIATADIARTPAAAGSISYNGGTNSLVYRDAVSGQFYIAYLQRTVGAEMSVGAIIADLCLRVGLTADMINVTAVTATTVGYVVRDLKSAGAAIADLCHVYQIDMVESDYVLKFIPRGQAPVATIAQADLGSIDANDMSQFWGAKAALEQEMPLQINIKYADPDLDYQPGAAYARRTALPVPTQYSQRKLLIDLPVVATNQEARQIAEKWLYTSWAERNTYETMLGLKYLWLDPTDNVTVDLDNGDSYTVRIEQIETGADLALKVSLASEDITTYAPTTTPGATFGVGVQTLTAAGFASLLQINVPLLQDADATPAGRIRIYYAADGSNAGWKGGVIYRSTDAVNWPQFGTLPSAANVGTALTALGDTVSPFSTDHTNSVIVTFNGGATLPSSCAYIDLMNGANAALCGQEIIQFQTVTDNADGSLTLSDIVRGRRGTEWATGLHAAGETFLLLQAGLVVGNALTTGEIGTGELYKLVSIGATFSSTPASGFAYLGYDLKPYAPINFTRAPSGSDLAVHWVRRTRIGGLLIDGSDTAPLSEESEAYSAYVLASAGALAAFDPTNAGTYVRAFTGLTAATLTYTAAQMSTDSFTPATDTLFLVVFQISGVIGRGFRGYQALPAF